MRVYCKTCQFQLYERRGRLWYDADGWAGSVAGSMGLWHDHAPPPEVRSVERAVSMRDSLVKPETR